MNGEDSTLADEYVQEFVLDNFENVPIKPEVAVSTSATGEGNVAKEDAVAATAATPSSGSPPLAVISEDEFGPRHVAPDSEVVPHHSQVPHRPDTVSLPLPSPLLHSHSQASPPHHLLTPPDNRSEHYAPSSLHHYHHLHHHHHQVRSGSMVMSSVKTGNLIMYSNIPGTPPDTPPVSNSPSPPQSQSIHHHHLEHHNQIHHQTQYSQLQPLHHHHHHHHHSYQKGSGVVDDMLWLSSQSMDLRPSRQEPLDLRPNCNGDALHNWNMTQHQHTSVITGAGKRIFHADYFHHQSSYGARQVGASQPQPLSPLLTTSCLSPSGGSISSSSLSLSVTTSSAKSVALHSGGLVSPASSNGGRASTGSVSRYPNKGVAATKLYCGGGGSSGSANDDESVLDGHSHGRPGTAEMDIDDDLLVALSVRDLNARLKGTPKDKQLVVKQRRRTLKNRGYARNCRNKRVVQRDELEFTNHRLQNDLSHEKVRSLNMQNEISRLQSELTSEKRRGHNLQNKLRELQADLERLGQQLAENATAAATTTDASGAIQGAHLARGADSLANLPAPPATVANYL